MKRIEVFSVVAVLCVGSVAGFGSARWGESSDVRPTHSAEVTVVTDGIQQAQEKPARLQSETDLLANLRKDTLRSRRRVALDRFCDGLDAAGARREMEALPPGETSEQQEVRVQLMSRWAELDPEAAALFAQEKVHSLFGMVLNVWARTDRDAAKKFVSAIKDKDLLHKILYGFTGSLAEDDFEDALRFATAMPADHFNNAIRSVFLREARKNPAAASGRALAMPEGDARRSAISAAVEVWVQANPQAAMAWVMQRSETPTRFGRLFQDAIQSWAESDPAGASRFVQNLTGKKRDDGIKSVVRSWAFRDIDSSLRWVQSLPEDATKTEAFQDVVSPWAYDDPPAAAAFLARQSANVKTGELLADIGGNGRIAIPPQPWLGRRASRTTLWRRMWRPKLLIRWRRKIPLPPWLPSVRCTARRREPERLRRLPKAGRPAMPARPRNGC